MRRSPRALVAALLGMVALTVVPLRAGTAAAQDDDLSARLFVTSMTGVIGPAVATADEEPPEDLRISVLVENDGPADLDNVRVVVETYRATSARSLLHAALDDGDLPSGATSVTPVDIRDSGTLPPGDVAATEVRVPRDRGGWAGDDGVFPVQVSVVRGTEVLDRVVTAVVHLVELGPPLRTALVWPVDTASQRGPDGSYPVGMDALAAPGGSIDARLTAFERVADTPVTLLVGATLLEELQDRADGFLREDGSFVPDNDPAAEHSAALLARLRSAAEGATNDPVAGPYGGVDVAALASGPAEVAELAVTAMATARTRVQQLLGRPPDLQTYVSTTPLTPQSLDVLPIDHVLLPFEDVLLAPDESAEFPDLPPATRQLSSAAGRLVGATAADPFVSAILAGADDSHGAAVARQRLVAETAMIYLQAPQEAGRVLLVLPERAWSPRPLTALEQARGLVGSPWLELAAPSALTSGTPPLKSVLDRAAASLPSSFVGQLSSARHLLDALQAAVPEPEVDGLTPQELSDALLRAATPEALDQAAAPALERINRITRLVEEGFGVVDIPESRRVTLASDSGEVPVTIVRREGGDIRVIVEVDSVGRLVWDDDARTQEVVLPADSSRTVAFRTTAVSRGTFPVTVSVWDPTRTRLLDSSTLSVRAAAISTPALVGIGAVVVILLAAGARRRRKPALEVVR
jgi:hypothetical protein